MIKQKRTSAHLGRDVQMVNVASVVQMSVLASVTTVACLTSSHGSSYPPKVNADYQPPHSAPLPIQSDTETHCNSDEDCVTFQKDGNTSTQSGDASVCADRKCYRYDEQDLLEWAEAMLDMHWGPSTSEPKLTEASWFKPGANITLYLPRIFAFRHTQESSLCTAIHFHMGESNLDANFDENGRQVSPDSYGCSSALVLERLPILFTGSCRTKDVSGGFGGAELLGDYLSQVDDRGLVYDGYYKKVEVVCSNVVLRRSACDPPECRYCQPRLVWKGQAGRSFIGSKRPADSVYDARSKACSPCLPDPMRTITKSLDSILHNMSFFAVLDWTDSFRIFRSLSDCENFSRAIHPDTN